MWRLTLALAVLFPLSADYSVVMCGASPGTLVTWPWRRLSMTYYCAQTLVSDMHHVLELLVPGFRHPVLLCQGRMPRARMMAAYVRDGYGAFRQLKFECGCCKNAGF